MRLPLPPFLREYITEEGISDQGLWWLNLVRTHSIDIKVVTFTLNPANLAANTHVEETVTITGLNTDDIILSVTKPTFTQGFLIGSSRVSAADTLAIQIANGTGSAANPGSETYTVAYIKNSSK